MKILTKLKRIKKKQVELDRQLTQLQEECQHSNRLIKYGSNTGNWSPSDDLYWADFYCPECEKRWTVDSKDSQYRNLNNYREVKEWPKGMYDFYRQQ